MADNPISLTGGGNYQEANDFTALDALADISSIELHAMNRPWSFPEIHHFYQDSGSNAISCVASTE